MNDAELDAIAGGKSGGSPTTEVQTTSVTAQTVQAVQGPAVEAVVGPTVEAVIGTQTQAAVVVT